MTLSNQKATITEKQKETIIRVYSKIKKYNPDVELEVSNDSLRDWKDVSKGHVDVTIKDVRFNKVEFYAEFEINTAGTITKGTNDYLTPIRTVELEHYACDA